MAAELRTFNTADHIVGIDLDIRVVDMDGEPWFVRNDVINALGISKWGGVLNPLGQDEKRKYGRASLGLRGGRDVWIISESGLYKLIMRSDKPQARAFQDWVTKIVLPAIRKDGMYVSGEEKVSTGEMSEDELILKAMEALQRKNERLEQENQYMDSELNLITVDEYRALSHRYFTRGFASKLGRKASKLAQEKGMFLDKQQRRLIKPNGEPETVFVNVYPRDLIEEAEGIIIGLS